MQARWKFTHGYACMLMMLLIVSPFVLLGGCGGQNKGGNGGTSSSGQTGRAVLTVRWPERNRLIPIASQSIRVRIAHGSQLYGEKLLTRPDNGGTTSTTLDRIPTGGSTVSAIAYPNADGSGVGQAQGQVNITVNANQTTDVHLTLASTISHLAVDPGTVSVETGQSVTPVATAYNSQHEVVLILPATLTWASDQTAIATVDNTGKISGVAAGTATVTVTETESGKKAGITVHVTAAAPSIPADAVLNPANGHYYKVYSVPAGITWVDAKAAAEAVGGYLATVTSDDENQFVFNLVNHDNLWTSDHLGPWIGGFQPPGSPEPAGGWQWVTGEPWSYTHWYPNQPDNSHDGESRLHYYVAPGEALAPTWNDFPDQWPTYPIAYVVEWGAPSSPTPTPTPTPTPPPGVVKCDPNSDHCYEVVQTTAQINWKDAKTAAESRTYNGLPGHLVTITSQAEMDFLTANFTLSNFWLGGYQDSSIWGYSEPGGGWSWVTGESWVYSNWNNGEPNNANPNEDYTQFWTAAPGKWNDVAYNSPADMPTGYVVEYEPGNGDLLVYDSFHYTSGDAVAGKLGELRWVRGWSDYGDPRHTPTIVADAGLTYPGLKTTGKAMQTTSYYPVGNFNIPTYPIGKEGDVLYFSILIRPLAVSGTQSGGDSYFGFGFSDMGIGKGGASVFEISKGGVVVRSNVVAEANKTYFLVLRATFRAGNDKFEIWINPTVGQPLPTPDIVTEAIDTAPPIGDIGVGSSVPVIFDEYRVGRTWESVSPKQ